MSLISELKSCFCTQFISDSQVCLLYYVQVDALLNWPGYRKYVEDGIILSKLKYWQHKLEIWARRWTSSFTTLDPDLTFEIYAKYLSLRFLPFKNNTCNFCDKVMVDKLKITHSGRFLLKLIYDKKINGMNIVIKLSWTIKLAQWQRETMLKW